MLDQKFERRNKHNILLAAERLYSLRIYELLLTSRPCARAGAATSGYGAGVAGQDVAPHAVWHILEKTERGPGIRGVVGDTAAVASAVKQPAAMGRFWVTAATLVTAIVLVAPEVVSFSGCPGVSTDQCTVTSVRIDLCREVPNQCNLKRGIDVSFNFDFIPKFTAQRLKTEVYWVTREEIRFPSVDSDGCKSTACPTRPDASATFNYTEHVIRIMTSDPYTIKWKLWNEENESQVCCFVTNVKLRKYS